MIFWLSPHLTQPTALIGAKAQGLVTLMRLGLPVPAAFVIAIPPRPAGRPAPPPPPTANHDAVRPAPPPPATAAPDPAQPAPPPPATATHDPTQPAPPPPATATHDPTQLAPSSPATAAHHPAPSPPAAATPDPDQLAPSAPTTATYDPARPAPANWTDVRAHRSLLPSDEALKTAVVRLGAEAVSVRSGAAVSMPGMMNTVLDVRGPVAPAVHEVVESWNTRRAVAYRDLHGIPHDLGTAVIVQAMVHGDRDDRSGSGVAFSRNPGSGSPEPYGDVLFGDRGDAVVSGECDTLPLTALHDREPTVWTELVSALTRLEAHYRDACHVEFTFESGRLWLLQVRPGGLTPRAAVRVAVDLADEGLIDCSEAVRRVSPHQLKAAVTPRMAAAEILTRGRGASPGVATGRVALTADNAVRMSGPVILVRPVTSPLDMHGLAAAAGVVTSRGGPTSHAAVVARGLGKPAVVGAAGLDQLTEGTLITIDGSSGEIALGEVPSAPGESDPHLRRLLTWAAATHRH
ncbi:PEP/pyruvate-binding domain-containing protein [Paractinoplanes ovalisporus]|uniref:PEP/pyruvate-binding domain-containing protein n=1 Tax=Paractinoplanes ovalisporus TaxID=2810368 RepID=UPI001EEB706E|nr:PEP/pyruvate-binding domain-containing protein [Actinoplanes ovalisporus]